MKQKQSKELTMREVRRFCKKHKTTRMRCNEDCYF